MEIIVVIGCGILLLLLLEIGAQDSRNRQLEEQNRRLQALVTIQGNNAQANSLGCGWLVILVLVCIILGQLAPPVLALLR